MGTGRLLGAGRTADVYEYEYDIDGGTGDGAWVLRRYRDGWGDAVAEAEVMEHVRGHGYPVPRVRAATRTDLILQRLAGPTLVEAIAEGTLTQAEAGAILALLLHDLHAIPPRRSTAPEARVLHLDLHPENVILTPRGPMVIDWSNTEEGPPGLDWGMSAVILAQVAVADDDPRAGLAHNTLAALLNHPTAAPALTEEGLREARSRRAANPTMTGVEIQLLGRAEELIRALGGASIRTPGA
ncbi:phosphotransferase [Streptomyces ipomoeae]|uniref:Phosphotransferase enzyme family protein n=1 Tax=Streptomyces ipomoeae 91-03 TaxID=698759 RepID=L1KV38_9ACTN|nr:phosphotransferase [Streptomyces ipomoeae]EKX64681.1 phosphotransferase enzyme family protein [Streptomyces ipomoeae 91-03]MDX2700679.1 phosphotransferase [Streptomyces ipomoeae]MDX2842130.1 phosphotransferase [Streptomyces ipomoeae]